MSPFFSSSSGKGKAKKSTSSSRHQNHSKSSTNRRTSSSARKSTSTQPGASSSLSASQQGRLLAHRPPKMQPQDLISINDFENEARRVLPVMVRDYYRSGSDDMHTLRWNLEEFSRIRLKARVLRDVSDPKLETSLFGCKLKFPCIVAPTAMHRMAHEEGEIGSSKAANRFGTAFCLSTLATTKMSHIKEANQENANLFFQLYVLKDREFTKRLVQEAESNGFKALFVTVDAAQLGSREPDHRNKFHLPEGLSLENLLSNLDEKMDAESSLSAYFADQIDASLTWKDIEWLRSITKLPIVLKGIQCAEDAVLAAQHGCEGIVVSNHGARQLDTSVSTVEILAEVVDAVRNQAKNSDMKILIDGGIRRGSSILKCLAMGADCVLIGRPVLWGLAVGGEEGVYRVLEILYKELRLAMQLFGAKDLEELKNMKNNVKMIRSRL